MRVSFHDLLAQCAATLWAHKLRSALTAFGIAWGIASLLLLASIGEGFQRAQKREFDKIGEDLIFFWPGRVIFGQGTRAGARPVFFNYGDYETIQAECSLVKKITPVVGQNNVRITSSINHGNFGVAGVLPSYFEIRTAPLATGRLITPGDSEERRQVAVLGDEIRRILFGGRPALGETVYINRLPFTVIGVLKRVGEPRRPLNLSAYLPFHTAQKFFPTPGSPDPDPINTFILQPVDPDRNRETTAQVRRVLERRHGFGPEHKDAVDGWDGIELYRQVVLVVRVMDFFLGGVGGVTLALGAVGVLNIMLLTVAERTVEIGIRKAAGATSSDILWQFFIESLYLTFGAGALGLLGGWLVNRLLSQPDYPPGFGAPVLTWKLALLGVALLSAVGIAAGLYPARRAAAVSPAEALRAEV